MAMELPERPVTLVALASQGEQTAVPVSFLPPLVLNFAYPPSYPSIAAPTYTLTCKWLHVGLMSRLCRQLDALWAEQRGDVVLFRWLAFLQDEAFAFLQLDPAAIDIRVIKPPRPADEPAAWNTSSRSALLTAAGRRTRQQHGDRCAGA